MGMRSLLVVLVLAACGARPAPTTLPVKSPSVAPAHDLAEVKPAKPAEADHAEQKDPRVVDLDIIRISAKETSPGNVEMEHVATADLFKQANDAAKSGATQQAISLYRRIVSDFAESQFAPVCLFNIAAIYDGQGDLPQTIATLRELVKSYPKARESIDGHLYIAALQADHEQYADANKTLDEILVRDNLTFADKVEAYARKGYVLLELKQYDDADKALQQAVAQWRAANHIDDPYYIAMASYYRGELAHRKFLEAPVRLPDDQEVADLEQKRVLAVQAYDFWKAALGFKQAYWATASGYQMSQIFVELWQATVLAPVPKKLEAATRSQYIADVHDRVREHLEKALEGHRMNIELAKAYGVDTTWSKGSEQRAVQIMQMLADDSAGHYVTPSN
jgi:tetratricopeptide (TPR) repeat protein